MCNTPTKCILYMYARNKGLKMSLWLWYEQNVHMFKNIHIFVIFSQLILSVGYTIMVEHESYFVHGMGFYADVHKIKIVHCFMRTFQFIYCSVLVLLCHFVLIINILYLCLCLMLLVILINFLSASLFWYISRYEMELLL